MIHQEKSRSQNVSLYQDEWEVVEWVMKREGLRKYSAALRHIINDYRTRHTPNLPQLPPNQTNQ